MPFRNTNLCLKSLKMFAQLRSAIFPPFTVQYEFGQRFSLNGHLLGCEFALVKAKVLEFGARHYTGDRFIAESKGRKE